MKYSILFFIIITAIACKKDEIPTYEGQAGVSFYIGQYDVDSLSYSFAFSVVEKERDTVFLDMRVVGAASDVPRTITVKAAEGTTAREGIDYELPAATLPANELTAKYPVVLINSEELKNSTLRLVVEVAESKDLKPGATGQEIGNSINVSRIKIDFSNQLIKPSYWDNTDFGDFSAVKFRFMIEVTGLTDFSQEAIGLSGIYNLPVTLRNALDDYEAENGPLIDEFGNPVTF